MITKEQKAHFRKTVGKMLEKRRLEKGISRKELGVALGYEGNCAVQVVARFESGRAGVPKAKIEKLLGVLDISNNDFGLVDSKSLKNFIAASGFLNPPAPSRSSAMVDFMESTEVCGLNQTLVENESRDAQPNAPQIDVYQDVIRIMRLYRVQKKYLEHTLFEQLDMMDTLSDGDEVKLSEMLAIFKIAPGDAYREIENHLMERLKGTANLT